jgi:topoisomerase IV subunit B
LKHALRAKAVLCPGLAVRLKVEKPKESIEWLYSGGLEEYLLEAVGNMPHLPAEPYSGSLAGTHEAVDWAIVWQTEEGTAVQESYVNLIPTPQGGTHVNGLRTGLTNALREFCEFRSLLPRGVQLSPEDVWDGLSFVLSAKLENPQFSGQTKERLSSRESAAFVTGVVKDSFALWLNQHPETGDQIACLPSARRSHDCARRKRWCARKSSPVRHCRGNWRTALRRSPNSASCFWSRATRPAVRPSRRATAHRPSCRCAARS